MCTKINLLKTLYNPSDYSVDVYLNLIDISSCKLEHFTLHFSFIPDQRRESRLVVHLQLLGANICSVEPGKRSGKYEVFLAHMRSVRTQTTNSLCSVSIWSLDGLSAGMLRERKGKDVSSEGKLKLVKPNDSVMK